MRRFKKLIESSENENKVRDNLIYYQAKMKSIFDIKAKEFLFQEGDLVSIWDTRREDNGKHGKFDPL